MQKRCALYSNEEPRGWMPWTAVSPFLGILFVIVSTLPIGFILTEKGLYGDDGNFADAGTLALFLFAGFTPMGVAVVLWTKWIEKRSLASIGLNGPTKSKPFFLGQLIGVLSSGSIVIAILLCGAYQADFSTLLHGITDLPNFAYIILLLAGFTIQSGVEELLFRGWLLSAISRKSNLTLGIILSSAVFSLLHFEPDALWFVHINLLLFSLFACSWTIRSNNIWGAMGWHAGWNWFIGTGFGIPITGVSVDLKASIMELTPSGPEWLTGGTGGPENSVFCTCFFLIGIAYCVWFRKPKVSTTIDS